MQKMASQGAGTKEERKKRLRFIEENNVSNRQEQRLEKCEDRQRRYITASIKREHNTKPKPYSGKWKLGLEMAKCQVKHEKVDVDGQKLDILKKLGGGSFSCTYEVFGKDKKLHVLKMVRLMGQVEKSVLKEVNLLTKLAIEPKIVRLEVHEVRLTRKGVMMLLLMEHGDCSISDVFLQPKSISISSLLFYWESILKCVLVLHSKNIIHLDIKPANFILMQGNAKVTDLSSAELLPTRNNYILMEYQKGTTGFMGPECTNYYKNKMFRYSLKTDVFPLGVILHALIFKTEGEQPNNLRLFEFLRKVVTNSIGENQFQRPSIDQLLKYLGTLAVVPSPKRRKCNVQNRI